VLGLAVADRLGGGPAEGSAADVVVEVDGDGVLGDVDGHDGIGMRSAEGDLLAGDHDAAAVGGPSRHGDRAGDRGWWWSGWAGSVAWLTCWQSDGAVSSTCD
jgi:hypothetical protein